MQRDAEGFNYLLLNDNDGQKLIYFKGNSDVTKM